MVSLATAQSRDIKTADGTPLKRKLSRTLRRSKIQAFALVSPLLVFISASFLWPVAALLWQGLHNDTFAALMPDTTVYLKDWDGRKIPSEDGFTALHADLVKARQARTIGRVATRVNLELPGARSVFTRSARAAGRIKEGPYKQALIDTQQDWATIELWQAMKVASQSLTPAFYLAAIDRQYQADGDIVMQEEGRRIHVFLFGRTLWISALVMGLCLLLGFPVAYLLANLPLRISNLLMILVLLPFWTSLLVRTTAWIAMLQSNGVINDIMVSIGLTSDDQRLQMIYNQTGTIIAMTHILLPFMILPLYSVMSTIPPTYMRAAQSLGATSFVAFRRVYLPQTTAGIGAGCLLVFILAIGYYITPALVGGQSGQLISNIIAFHMQKSLNWSLAAALGGLLLLGVLALYWLYDRVVGIDNMKLG